LGEESTVGIDENISRRAGVLGGQHLLSDSKLTLGPGNAIVAATELVYSEPVITNDTDFQSVDGLRVELY
jgi:predicted nucleic acid-binding protein